MLIMAGMEWIGNGPAFMDRAQNVLRSPEKRIHYSNRNSSNLKKVGDVLVQRILHDDGEEGNSFVEDHPSKNNDIAYGKNARGVLVIARFKMSQIITIIIVIAVVSAAVVVVTAAVLLATIAIVMIPPKAQGRWLTLEKKMRIQAVNIQLIVKRESCGKDWACRGTK